MESYVAVRYGRVRLGRLAASQGVQHKVSALRHSDLGQPRYRIAQRWIGALKPLEFSPRFIHAVTAFFVLHIDFRPRRGQKDARVVAMRLGNRVQNSSAVQCLGCCRRVDQATVVNADSKLTHFPLRLPI